MSMTMVPPVSDAVTTPDDRAPGGALAASRATTFLRAQALWLRKGLLIAADDVAVDIVLTAHDRSHERWLGIVAATAQALGDEAAERVANLYGYFGRVAGALAAGAITLLPEDTASAAREMIADRLVDVTENTVEALWTAAAQA